MSDRMKALFATHTLSEVAEIGWTGEGDPNVAALLKEKADAQAEAIVAETQHRAEHTARMRERFSVDIAPTEEPVKTVKVHRKTNWKQEREAQNRW